VQYTTDPHLTRSTGTNPTRDLKHRFYSVLD
jgi:hypothetical protein